MSYQTGTSLTCCSLQASAPFPNIPLSIDGGEVTLLNILGPTSGPQLPRHRAYCIQCQSLNVVQGSGKTLAFGLPILQLLDAAAPAAGADAVTTEALPTEGDPVKGEGQQTAAGLGQKPLRALILEPTRELAMQVSLSACLRLHCAFCDPEQGTLYQALLQGP